MVDFHTPKGPYCKSGYIDSGSEEFLNNLKYAWNNFVLLIENENKKLKEELMERSKAETDAVFTIRNDLDKVLKFHLQEIERNLNAHRRKICEPATKKFILSSTSIRSITSRGDVAFNEYIINKIYIADIKVEDRALKILWELKMKYEENGTREFSAQSWYETPLGIPYDIDWYNYEMNVEFNNIQESNEESFIAGIELAVCKIKEHISEEILNLITTKRPTFKEF